MSSAELHSLFLKLVKFGLVGLTGVGIDFGITFLLKEKAKTNKYVANICGFSIAVCSNFILNKWWTFQNTETDYFSQFTAFVTVAVVGLLISQLVLYVLHEYIGIKFYFAKLIAIGIVTFWNFGFSHFFVFST